MESSLNIHKGKVLVSLILILTLALTGWLIFYDAKQSRIKEKPMLTKIINKQFNLSTGEHYQLAQFAKNNLDFPYSYRHLETFYIRDESQQAVLVKTIFKSRDTYNTERFNCFKAIYSYYGKNILPPKPCVVSYG